MTLQLRMVTLTTELFDDLSHNDALILAHRVLSLPWVDEVDYIHGSLKVRVPPDSLRYPLRMTVRLEILKRHLQAPLAPGEDVLEVFHEGGKDVYTYKYIKGDYDNGGDW